MTNEILISLPSHKEAMVLRMKPQLSGHIDLILEDINDNLGEKRFKTIANNTLNIIMILDTNEIYTYISPNTLKLFGIKNEKLMGQHFENIFDYIEDEESTKLQLLELIRNINKGSVNCRLCPATGGYRWYTFKALQIQDKGENLVETIFIGKDYTKNKMQEDWLKYIDTHDTLTKTYNKIFFRKEIKRLQKENIINFCIVLVDVNGLDNFNEILWNQKDDRIIKETSEILKRIFSRKCFIARIDGYRFGLIIYGRTMEETEILCKKMNEEWDETRDINMSISLSYGISYRYDLSLRVNHVLKLAKSKL